MSRKGFCQLIAIGDSRALLQSRVVPQSCQVLRNHPIGTACLTEDR